MRIRRFFEAEQGDISNERVSEILDILKEMITNIEEKNKFIDSLGNELSNYKNQSTKSNDQIDDTIAALQIIKKNFDDVVDKLDTSVNNLDDYNQSGRKYLYTETK